MRISGKEVTFSAKSTVFGRISSLNQDVIHMALNVKIWKDLLKTNKLFLQRITCHFMI